MPSLQGLPVELVQKISSSLDNGDLLSLSLTSKLFLERTMYEWRKRVRAKWAIGREVFFRVCATGGVRAAAELVTKANADPNIGFATGHQDFWENARAFPRLGLEMEVKSFASLDPDDFCPYIQLGGESTHLVRFDGTADTDSIPVDLRPDSSMMITFPLHVAAACGQLGMVEFLLRSGAHLDPPCYRAFTPRNIQEVDGPTDFEEAHKCEYLNMTVTPLYLAINNKHLAVADLLIRSGASLNLPPSDFRRLSAFHVAVGAEGTEMTKFFIGQGPYSLEETNYAGLTPIWLAYLNQNWETFELLLSLGADIDHALDNGFTPLVHALSNHDYEAVKKLLAAGAKKNIPYRPVSNSFRHCSDPNPTPMKPIDWWVQSMVCEPALSANVNLNHGDDVCGFLGWLVANNEIDVEKTSPDGVALSTMLFKRNCTMLTNFLDRGLDSYVLWSLMSPKAWRTRVLGLLFGLGADPMARDLCKNSLLDLCLEGMDLVSYRTVANSTPQGKLHFAKHFSLDRIMERFAWPHSRSAIDPSGNLWEEVAKAYLQTLMDVGLATSSDITHHPDFARLLSESIMQEQLGVLLEFLIGLNPPVAHLMTACDGKTPLQIAIARSPRLICSLLAAGVDPNIVPEGGIPVPPIVQALQPSCGWQALEHLVRGGVNVHIEGPDSSNPIIEALVGMSAPGFQSPTRLGFENPHEHYWPLLAYMLAYHPLTDCSAPLAKRYIRVACDGNNEVALRLLLIFGADPDCILDNGHTPMTYLIRQVINGQRTWGSCFDLIQQLIIFGASLDKEPSPDDGSDPKTPRRYFYEMVSQMLDGNPIQLTIAGGCEGGYNHLSSLPLYLTVQGEDVGLKTFRHAFYPEQRYPVPPRPKDPHEVESRRNYRRAFGSNGSWDQGMGMGSPTGNELCGYDDFEVIAEGCGGSWRRRFDAAI